MTTKTLVFCSVLLCDIYGNEGNITWKYLLCQWFWPQAKLIKGLHVIENCRMLHNLTNVENMNLANINLFRLTYFKLDFKHIRKWYKIWDTEKKGSNFVYHYANIHQNGNELLSLVEVLLITNLPLSRMIHLLITIKIVEKWG